MSHLEGLAVQCPQEHFFPKAADLLLVKVMVTIENQLLTVTSLTRKDISPSKRCPGEEGAMSGSGIDTGASTTGAGPVSRAGFD